MGTTNSDSQGRKLNGCLLYVTNHFTHPVTEAQSASPRHHLARVLMERGQKMIVFCPVGKHVGTLWNDFLVNLVPVKRTQKNTTYLFPPMLKFPGGVGTALALITSSIFLLTYLFLTRTRLVAQYSTTVLVSVVGAVLKSVWGVPLVANYGDPDFARETGLARVAFRFCEKLVILRRKADCVVYVDELIGKYIQKNYSPKRTLFLPNGGYQAGLTPEDRHSTRVNNLRRGLNLESKRTILYAGQIEPVYRLDVLASAAVSIISKVADVEFVIIGDGASLPELRETVASLKLADHFKFLGQIPYTELGPYLALSDVCVNITRDWCMGTKVIMYMSHHRPVLSAGSWCGDYGEFLRSGKNCVLVPPEKGPLSDALIELLKNDQLRESLGEAAWDTVHRYTWDYHADETLRMLEGAIRSNS